ncbi:MAG: hypothetical protein ACHQ50_13575 [Fimbriimonadales bacterium]
MRVVDPVRLLGEIVVVPAEGGGFFAHWGELPHLSAAGSTADEARWRLIDILNVRFADEHECCSSEPVVEDEAQGPPSNRPRPRPGDL